MRDFDFQKCFSNNKMTEIMVMDVKNYSLSNLAFAKLSPVDEDTVYHSIDSVLFAATPSIPIS